MTPRSITPGPLLDSLVADQLMEGNLRPFSTNPGYAAQVFQEITERGFEIDFTEFDVIVCSLKRDSKRIVSTWGTTYEEAICRAGLKLVGREPA